MNNIKVAICVPTAGMVSAWFAQSLAQLACYTVAMGQRPEAESFESTLFIQATSVIHANRETLVKRALEWGATHVMFLDDDMVFPPHVLTLLLGRRHPFVACNYPKRGWPVTFTAIRVDGKAAIVTHEKSSGLEEASYTGFGVSLIERQVFEKTPQPWFLPLWYPNAESPDGGVYTTEDNPFCQRIAEQGFKVYVDHDASKLIGHHGAHTFQWNQYQPPKPQADVVPITKGAAA